MTIPVNATATFLQLAKNTDPDDLDIVAMQDSVTGDFYYVLRSDLLKNISLVSFTESEYDNGSIASGTFTPDCDANGNAHLVTITGDCTIEVPTKALTGSQIIESAITVVNGGSATVTWGSNWDFGDAGIPTLTSAGKDIIGFKRRAGDTKTTAWYTLGYS